MGSGARRSGRIDGEGRWGRSLKTMMMAAARGPSGRVRRRGGRGRNSGALGGVGEARRWLWPRERWSAATGSIRSREGKQRSEGEGGPESEGEVIGGRGGAWRLRASRREATRQEVAKRGGGARHRAASCAGTGRRQACPLVVGLHSVGLSRWASVSAR